MLGLGVLLLVGVAGLAASALLTSWLARRIEAEHPPTGRFVDVGPTRVHLVDLAPAVSADENLPAVLLLHGANVQLADMRVALGDRLARRLRVIVPDRPGQGWTGEGGPVVSDPGHQVALIRAAVEAVGARRLIVVGHSLGGLIALRYALDEPQAVAALVLINPTTHPRPGGLPWYQRAAEVVFGPLLIRTVLLPMTLPMLDRLSVRLFRPEPPTEGYAARTGLALGLTPRRFLASMREYADLRDHLTAVAPRYPDITVPTLIVLAEADPIVPPALHGEILAKVLPRGRVLRLPGAGHMAHHRHGEAIAAAIERLAGLPPG
ncbi:2-hydroxy-6-oxononadienedioate/2-hydroxy-6-oxononatrienedioate hydrolase [Rhodoplanes serenus]|uniref:2-hydroxy-6-oxononadienedioate/2-hydroxy-6-oxonon atrienedioate hydrolase n=1 Tax=Rhodoplanes serenus TaxID=200615 RepID=A0A447CVY3_9BRAD|nr:alpha/beta hydrolase [Rhodoplanes serenus]VCU09468.1 2-hydroxy-6-oxononadienedioate/2-hydroxy-6-oxononatrienedioate hydrolase [Rhodoplanes serenus]